MYTLNLSTANFIADCDEGKQCAINMDKCDYTYMTKHVCMHVLSINGD